MSIDVGFELGNLFEEKWPDDNPQLLFEKFLKGCFYHFVACSAQPCFAETRLGITPMNIYNGRLSPVGILMMGTMYTSNSFSLNLEDESTIIYEFGLRYHRRRTILALEEIHDKLVLAQKKEAGLPMLAEIVTGCQREGDLITKVCGENLNDVILSTIRRKS